MAMQHYFRETRPKGEPDLCAITGIECERSISLIPGALGEGDCRTCIFAHVQFAKDQGEGK